GLTLETSAQVRGLILQSGDLGRGLTLESGDLGRGLTLESSAQVRGLVLESGDLGRGLALESGELRVPGIGKAIVTFLKLIRLRIPLAFCLDQLGLGLRVLRVDKLYRRRGGARHQLMGALQEYLRPGVGHGRGLLRALAPRHGL